ncbi:unnamed protein product [Cyprideis torosa]|uniref:Uncharacterized protein n=1 Tax=Cyprideis torosa TaxID=163714 RepID=A0A7R8ZQT8_9CRUS|nr:unnamed protein product [Cyprideis torosa]CAG0903732.1 unnamed protein product [Cyprideis torosa]
MTTTQLRAFFVHQSTTQLRAFFVRQSNFRRRPWKLPRPEFLSVNTDRECPCDNQQTTAHQKNMVSKRATQQVLICFCIVGIVAEQFNKFQRFPGFKCDKVSGGVIKTLDKAQCVLKGLLKKCFAVQTHPACQCCDTVTTADNSTAIYSAAACPGGGGVLNLITQKCYYVRMQVKGWNDARDDCRADGFDLVTIESAAENAFVFGLLSAEAWIGLNDIDSEGAFVWSDGSPREYTNWFDNEPDNSGGIQDCVNMNYPGDGGGLPAYGEKWDDADCNHPVPEYVCALKINPY